jgi:hypothetical protein
VFVEHEGAHGEFLTDGREAVKEERGAGGKERERRRREEKIRILAWET